MQALLARTATETGPLALIVDDAAWVDRSSATVLGTLAHSPHTGPISVLGASRTGDESLLSNIGIPRTRSGRWTTSRRTSWWPSGSRR